MLYLLEEILTSGSRIAESSRMFSLSTSSIIDGILTADYLWVFFALEAIIAAFDGLLNKGRCNVFYDCELKFMGRVFLQG